MNNLKGYCTAGSESIYRYSKGIVFIIYVADEGY